MSKKINNLLHENCFLMMLQKKPVHKIIDIKENLKLYKDIIAVSNELYNSLHEKADIEKISNLINEKKKLSIKYKKIVNCEWRL